MLYDNGQLLSLLSFAYRETEQPLFRARIDETVGWLVREMQLPGGGFASSLDADTEHEEGLTYVWTWPELAASRSATTSSDFAAIYDVIAGGQLGRQHTSSTALPPALASWLGDEREARASAHCEQSCSAGATRRPQPGRDDKVLADWNGLAISGLAQAARATGSDGRPQRGAEALSFRRRIDVGRRSARAFLAGGHARLPGRRDRLRQHDPRRARPLRARRRRRLSRARPKPGSRAADAHHFDAEIGRLQPRRRRRAAADRAAALASRTRRRRRRPARWQRTPRRSSC